MRKFTGSGVITVSDPIFTVYNLNISLIVYLGGGVGEGERRCGAVNGGNCGTGVRASISKPTPFIYLAFEKMDLFIYLIRRCGAINGGNCGTGVRASISKPTPFIYLAFE